MFETLFAFFAVGTLWFWLVVLGVIIAITVWSEEDGSSATIALVVGAFFLQFIAKYDVLSWILRQPMDLVAYALLYSAIGLAYACIKWWRYVNGQRREYDRFRSIFAKKRSIQDGEWSLQDKADFLEKLRDDYRYQRGKKSGGFNHYFDSDDANPLIPDVAKNKAAFIRWMTYWPLNLCYTLLNDPVRRFFEWLYEVVGKKLQAIADHAFKGTEQDLLTKKEKEELERQKQEKSRRY